MFGEADLRRAADGKSFERGLGYLDAVDDLEIGADEVTATVYGSDDYEVVLTLDDDGVGGECSCPYGQDGFFCKHLVAVGLTVLRQAADLPRQRNEAVTRKQSLDEWLGGLSHEELIELLRERVAEDRDFRRRLEVRAAAAASDVVAVRARVRDLLDVRHLSRHGYLEYGDAYAYSSQVNEAVAAIDALIDGGSSAEAVAIAGQALSAVLEALEQADDSDGSIGAAAQGIARTGVRGGAAGSARAGWVADRVRARGRGDAS
jgi:uncharacterized Zn finger protein